MPNTYKDLINHSKILKKQDEKVETAPQVIDIENSITEILKHSKHIQNYISYESNGRRLKVSLQEEVIGSNESLTASIDMKKVLLGDIGSRDITYARSRFNLRDSDLKHFGYKARTMGMEGKDAEYERLKNKTEGYTNQKTQRAEYESIYKLSLGHDAIYKEYEKLNSIEQKAEQCMFRSEGQKLIKLHSDGVINTLELAKRYEDINLLEQNNVALTNILVQIMTDKKHGDVASVVQKNEDILNELIDTIKDNTKYIEESTKYINSNKHFIENGLKAIEAQGQKTESPLVNLTGLTGEPATPKTEQNKEGDETQQKKPQQKQQQANNQIQGM